MLDRLVGRAVLAHADRVVCPHVGDRKVHEGGQAHGTAHEVGEHEEGTAIGAGQAVSGDAVQGCAHRELAHSEVQVATELVAGESRRGPVRGEEGRLSLHEGVVRTGEVGRAAP